MASKSKQRNKEQQDIALEMFRTGYRMVEHHPIFAPLLHHATVVRREGPLYPDEGLARGSQRGYIYCHPKKRAEPEVWAHVLAHCLLHLGMEHFVEKEQPIHWNIACDCVVEKFLADLKFGKPPGEIALPIPPGVSTEERLYLGLVCGDRKTEEYTGFGTAGERAADMIFDGLLPSSYFGRPKSWSAVFAAGLKLAVQGAVSVAAGYQDALGYDENAQTRSAATRAKAWFISSYPLLGAIAAAFKLIEDPMVCRRMEISVAAVSCGLQEIYLNPAAGLSEEECRFVMAHEFLHAALRHDARHQWRDAYLWNVACDYVINGWLIEMGVGESPDGLLLTLMMVLTGCWDSRTLEDQFILTGLALDVADDPGEISVTAQVANIQQGKAGSGEVGSEGGNESLVMKATGDSLMACLTELDRDSSQRLLFHHNQIRLFGIELAEQGIKKHLDTIMRDQKSRLEVPLAIVDGRGEDALTVKLSEMPLSGLFLGHNFDAQAAISPQYRVRLIDFVQRLLDDAAAPVIPIIKVTGKDDKQEIKMAGMAVFDDNRMIGRLTNEEAIGYILSFGDVKMCNISVSDGTDRAELHIATLDCQREVELRQDGGVRVSLTINSVINVGELYGFKGMKPPELLGHLENMAQEEIKNKITSCFSIAQSLDADIFGFCTMVYKQYPQQWSEMKDRWSEIFSDIDLNVQVKVRIPGTGQIVQSLEMEENMNEN